MLEGRADVVLRVTATARHLPESWDNGMSWAESWGLGMLESIRYDDWSHAENVQCWRLCYYWSLRR